VQKARLVDGRRELYSLARIKRACGHFYEMSRFIYEPFELSTRAGWIRRYKKEEK
jgi:hypothetical protein